MIFLTSTSLSIIPLPKSRTRTTTITAHHQFTSLDSRASSRDTRHLTHKPSRSHSQPPSSHAPDPSPAPPAYPPLSHLTPREHTSRTHTVATQPSIRTPRETSLRNPSPHATRIKRLQPAATQPSLTRLRAAHAVSRVGGRHGRIYVRTYVGTQRPRQRAYESRWKRKPVLQKGSLGGCLLYYAN